MMSNMSSSVYFSPPKCASPARHAANVENFDSTKSPTAKLAANLPNQSEVPVENDKIT